MLLPVRAVTGDTADTTDMAEGTHDPPQLPHERHRGPAVHRGRDGTEGSRAVPLAGAGDLVHVRRVRLLAPPVDDADDAADADGPQRGALRPRVPAVAPLLPAHSRRLPATGGRRHELPHPLLG